MRSPHRLGDRRWGRSAEPISCYSLATTHSIARRTPVRQQRPLIQRDAQDGRAHTLSMAYTDHEAVVHYHGWTIPGPSPAGQPPDRGGLIGWWGGPGPTARRSAVRSWRGVAALPPFFLPSRTAAPRCSGRPRAVAPAPARRGRPRSRRTAGPDPRVQSPG